MDNFKKLLATYLSFKSISADSNYKDDIHKCVNWLRETFEQKKFNVQIFEGYGNPLILAEYNINTNLPTILIYGHYDIQPANTDDGWDSDPYVLRETNAKWYGRGVIDNKGQNLIHMYSIFELIESNKLKYNVKILLEGDEETGSPLLENFLKDNIEKIKSDYILISDGTLFEDIPVVESSFRGIITFDLDLSTSTTDLHSGAYGSAVPNAAREAAKLVAKLHNPDNSINLPFLNSQIDEADRQKALEIPLNEENILQISQVKNLILPEGENFYVQTGLQNSIEINGITSGYGGEGSKTIIPSKANIKISVRLNAQTDFDKTLENLKTYFKSEIPDYVKWAISNIRGVNGVKVDTNDPIFAKVKEILKEVYDKNSIEQFVGGTIPIVKYFKDYLNVPILSIPLANEDSNMHGINENFDVECIEKGLEFSRRFLSS